MPKQSYFQNALSNFTHEVASGGAIRHLTDLGYTTKQIMERLDFPTPFERVQKEVWQRLLDTEVVLLEEPGSVQKEKVSYVREYDKYGHASFRRVVEPDGRKGEKILWRRHDLPDKAPDEILGRIRAKIEENGENSSYVACDFGLLAVKSPESYKQFLEALDVDLREYVEGLPWERRRVYHRLDGRMTKIWLSLGKNGGCFGECFFLTTKEVFNFNRKNS